MKKILFSNLFCLLMGVNLFAQDIITKTNGEEIKAKVTEITKEDVKYKRFENPDGPLFILGRHEVFMIKYENGTRDVFATTPVKEKSESKSKSTASEPKPFIPLFYAAGSLPVGAFGSETNEDGSAAKLGFSFGHQGLINLNGEKLFIVYDLSCNINPYSLTGYREYQIPTPPYYFYELVTIKGNYFNNLALIGLRYMSVDNSSPFYMGFSSGLNIPAITGYLKDEADIKVLPGVGVKINAGVLVNNHFDIGLSFLFSRPRWQYNTMPSYGYGAYQYTAEQKVSMLQFSFGYAF